MKYLIVVDQSISGYSDLLIMDLNKDNPVYERMHKIRLQVDKMVQISRELMHVTRYETQNYLEGKTIDIDKASQHSQSDNLN